jgi:hypothetical protein
VSAEADPADPDSADPVSAEADPDSADPDSADADWAGADWAGADWTEPDWTEPGGPVLWWPQSEYLRLARQLPALAASIGPGWTAHLARTEALLRERASSAPGPAGLVAADFGHFATYLRKNSVDPREPDVLSAYTPAAATAAAVLAWPPRPRKPCWCGSRRRYRDCCAASGGAAVLAG